MAVSYSQQKNRSRVSTPLAQISKSSARSGPAFSLTGTRARILHTSHHRHQWIALRARGLPPMTLFFQAKAASKNPLGLGSWRSLVLGLLGCNYADIVVRTLALSEPRTSSGAPSDLQINKPAMFFLNPLTPPAPFQRVCDRIYVQD